MREPHTTRIRQRRTSCLGIFLMVSAGIVCACSFLLFDIRGYLLVRTAPVPAGALEDSINGSIEYRGWWRLIELEQPASETLNYYQDMLTARGWRVEVKETTDSSAADSYCVKASQLGLLTTYMYITDIRATEPDTAPQRSRVFISVPPRASYCEDRF